MASNEISIPAHVLLQVRDGVPNKVFDFELKIDADGTRPANPEEVAEGATLSHAVSTLSMIGGLYGAIADLWRTSKDQYSPEDQVKVFRWLAKMNDWVVEISEKPVQIDPDPVS